MRIIVQCEEDSDGLVANACLDGPVCFNLLFISLLANTSASCRSTNLDSWTPEQLKMMAFGGNNRAQIFFKQHGWTDGGKIEAKYTSRAAEWYRQMLSKEVAKDLAEDNSLPSSPITVSQAPATGSGIPKLKLADETKASTNEQHETGIAYSPEAPVRSTFSVLSKSLLVQRRSEAGVED